MPLTSIITLTTFIATILALIFIQRRPAYIFAGALLVLYVTGVVSSEQVITSASNKGLLTLILLMLSSLALEKTRFLRTVATNVIKANYVSTWLRLFGSTVLSSAFLNNTAVVSTMLAPIRSNPHHPASRLLIPLSYAAILGGTLTLVGTSTNLIVNSLLIESGEAELAFFEFSKVGLFLVLLCGLALFVCSQFLPVRQLQKQQVKEYLIDAKVQPESALIGKSIEQNGLRHLESLFLVELVREGRLLSPVSPSEVIQPGDRLIFSGDVHKVRQLSQFDGLYLFAHENGLPINNLTEVVVRTDGTLVGRTLKEASFRARFDAAVVAIKRDGERVSGKLGELVLKGGDFLILAVGQDFKSRKNLSKNFIVLSGVEPDDSLVGWREWFAGVGFISVIAMAALGLMSLFKGMFLLLGVLILTKCLTVNELMRRIPKDIWVIIAAALVMSQALMGAGLLEALELWLSQLEGTLTPLTALILVYLLTWWLTELVTNNAAAALILPIALSIASSIGAPSLPYILAVAFGASASFISPYGYQTNLMVFNAGSYRLKDFVKIGLPVSLVYGATTVSALYWIYL
ncbi:SLC13 family permease [Vibrio mediterranei]|uniref:SLC13 family permease n=1 Tax=Vibrio mediterranei TaxID=689 RepID=UPI00148B8D51|nr:SLC13 family permease [Vibrio mediterranei]NOH29041.1 SLC13 family permease [Vibrio mediterranei]